MCLCVTRVSRRFCSAAVGRYGVVTEEASDKHVGPGPDSAAGSGARRGQMSVELVAAFELEWRPVLSRGVHAVTLELPGVGDEAKLGVPVGTLMVDMRLMPSGGVGTRYSQTDVARQVRAETELDAGSRRKFFQYAREWWKSYRETHESFQSRLVKLFAEDETGTHQPVCAYVRPLKAGRLLPSPRHAARFVSLLPFRRVDTASTSGDRSERWNSTVTTLALRYGDTSAHATLLCSLLLGFGLDAYVVLGTRLDARGIESDHAWVMTRDAHGDAPPDTVFWEALTGQRLAPKATAPSGHRWLRVGCVFNHRAFLANKQPNDLVESCSWAFGDDVMWKAMDAPLLGALRPPPAVPLSPPTLDAAKVAMAVETDLKAHIASMRDAMDVRARGLRYAGLGVVLRRGLVCVSVILSFCHSVSLASCLRFSTRSWSTCWGRRWRRTNWSASPPCTSATRSSSRVCGPTCRPGTRSRASPSPSTTCPPPA